MDLVLHVLSWACLGTGSAFAIIGGIGILRLPDFFSRMHGAGITDTMGAGLILLGLALQAADLVPEPPAPHADVARHAESALARPVPAGAEPAALVRGRPPATTALPAASAGKDRSPSALQRYVEIAQITFKLLMIGFFGFVTSPTAAHALAGAALARGRKPLLHDPAPEEGRPSAR